MDIIDFFRSIDGIPYYVMLIVNTILIFAIIGYLGEKSNDKYVNMELKNNVPDPGTVNLNPLIGDNHSNVNIPTVAKTAVDNQVENVVSSSLQNGIIPNVNSQVTMASNINQNIMPSMNNQNVIATSDLNGNVNNQINSLEPVNQQVIKPEDNDVDPNEKAPTVLVINSSNTNVPK